MLLGNEEFLDRLKDLFASSRQSGTVFLTQKRYSFDDAGDAVMKDDEPRTYPCLIRATDGKALKFSTLVSVEATPSFQTRYSAVVKASLSSLRPKKSKGGKGKGKEKGKKATSSVSASKKKKAVTATATGAAGKAKAGAKKEGKFALPKVVGPRRGAGVEKRRRSLRRRVKAVRAMRKREAARAKTAKG